jgi:hypothetical protein
MLKVTIKLLLFILISTNIFAGDTIAYTRDYDFKEGVFLTLEQFKNNSPILKANIVSALPKTDSDFLSQIIVQKTITYKNEKGEEEKVETATLWGYCQNRAVYINFNKSFQRVNVIGTLFHFTAMVTVYSPYNDPMGMNYGINSTYNQLQQFIYDTRANKVLDFNVKNMELILKDDDVLHKEFMKLKKKKKADSIFVYLRKYNENHPLYLYSR